MSELAVDAEDGLALGHDQAGEVLGEMAALALVGEQVTVSSEGVLDQLGNSTIPGMIACSAVQLHQSKSGAKQADLTYFDARDWRNAKPQMDVRARSGYPRKWSVNSCHIQTARRSRNSWRESGAKLEK